MMNHTDRYGPFRDTFVLAPGDLTLVMSGKSRLLPADQPEIRVMAHVKLVVEVLRLNKKVRAKPVRM